MKVFNAFQLVILLAIWPHLIGWLSDASFKGASAAFWASICFYIIQLLWTVYSYVLAFEERR